VVGQAHDYGRSLKKLCPSNIGVPSAEAGALVTFGIQPVTPETGYGYIRTGETEAENIFKVDRFVEKPDLTTAERYLASGEYFWNAGIFLFSAKAMLKAFETHAPNILQGSTKAIDEAKTVGASLFLDPVSFSQCESDSIDYAIMEKAGNVHIVAPVNMGWSDIGSWDALRLRALETDSLTQGSGNIITIDCKDTLVRSDGPTIAVVWVSFYLSNLCVLFLQFLTIFDNASEQYWERLRLSALKNHPP